MNHAAHEDLVDYKDYGLTFRFRLAEAAIFLKTTMTTRLTNKNLQKSILR